MSPAEQDQLLKARKAHQDDALKLLIGMSDRLNFDNYKERCRLCFEASAYLSNKVAKYYAEISERGEQQQLSPSDNTEDSQVAP